ncbi:MAG: hypothetical protein IFK94_16355, partial [Acidobacteria bacterium]|nr:hypothetical protein [Candidatus Polarisedimenticola svalbardensis]
MEFFRDPKINFVGTMKLAFTISAILVVVSAVTMLIHGGPRLSIDFTGGSVLQVKMDPVPTVGEIRTALEGQGYEGIQVTEFGSVDEFLITFPTPEDVVEAAAAGDEKAQNTGVSTVSGEKTLDAAQILLGDLRSGLSGTEIELRREESVGPKIGGELRTAA